MKNELKNIFLIQQDCFLLEKACALINNE